MTNKFRRSVTSVLLAASLLFSSQSVIAFADYGSKSDASDLSPVQESVEPVIGESQAMMAAPMNMEPLNGGNHCELPLDEIYVRFDCEDPNDDWPCEHYKKDFHDCDDAKDCHVCDRDGADYKVSLKNLPEDAYTVTPVGKHFKITLNMSDESLAQYFDTNAGCVSNCTHTFCKATRTIKVYKDWWHDSWNVDHFWVGLHCDGTSSPSTPDEAPDYENLVKVSVTCDREAGEGHDVTEIALKEGYYTTDTDWSDGEFTVSINNEQAEAYITENHNVVRVSESATFTWTDSEWKLSNNPITITSHCNSETYPINVEDLGLGINFDCDTENSHDITESILLKTHDENIYYTINPVTDVSATVTIKADKYLEDYNKTNAGHSLVNPNGEYIIQLTLVDNTKWIVEGDEIVTIPVTCKAETEKVTEVEVVLGDGIKEKLPYPYYWYSSVHAEYGAGDEYITLINNNNGGFHSHADKKDIPDDLTTEVNSVEKAKNFFTGFTFVEMNIFEENPWFPSNYIVDVSFENTKMIITLDTPANPDPEEPTINELDKILGNVIVHCITDGSGHEDKVFSFKDVDSDNVDGLYYEVNWTKENPTHATVTINHDPYVERYNLYTFPKSHKKAQDILETTFNLEWEDGEWKKADETASPITIAVTCSLPIPVLDNVYVQLKCLNNAGHDGNKIALKDLAIGSYYSCKIDENAKTATVSVNEQVNTWVTNSNTIGNPVHVWAENELNTVTLQYNNGWSLVDANNDTITIQTICAPTIDEINAKLDVSVDCNNANANPEHKAMIFEDLLADSYEIGTPELSGSEYICDVTVKAEKYVTEYDKEYRPEHSNADNQTVTFKFKDGKWTLKSDPTSVNFIVTCDFPNGPSEDEIAELGLKLQLNCATTPNPHGIAKYDVTDKNTFEVSDVIYTDAADAPSHYYVNVTVDGSSYLTQYNNDKGVHSWVGSNEAVFKVYARELEIARKTEYIWNIVDSETMTLQVQHTNPTDPTDPGTNPGGGGNNDDDDDRYTGDNTVTRTINDDDVPLNDRPTNTTTIDDEDVPLADLPDDTVTIDDGEVPLKDNPSTGDSLPFAAMAAAALSLGGVIVLNRKKK